MSYTVLFTADKERQLGVSEVFSNAWLYGPFIYDVLWPKYGKHFSLLDEMYRTYYLSLPAISLIMVAISATSTVPSPFTS